MFRRFFNSIAHRKRFYSTNNSSKFNKTSKKTDKENLDDIKKLIGPLTITSFGTAYILSKLNTEQEFYINWNQLKPMLNSEFNSVKKIQINKDFTADIITQNKIYKMNIGDISNFEKRILSYNENLNIEHTNPSLIGTLAKTLLPSLALMGGMLFILNKQRGGLTTFLKSDHKIITEKLGIKLNDIAGLHQTKKNVLEFADIIMKPEKYQKIGTKIPKGILMEGPPGTGKTMLAKAIADNYDSKFYLLNGSDFIQPIVGTGSKKVKDLFDTARKNTPAIIFIDEIDAVGKSRNSGKSIGNDERDNILNSLLVEMDGFDDNDKLLIMGATNRADTLDKALLRPGRFDRVVTFALPDLEERKDIIGLYYDKYKISSQIDKSSILDRLAYVTYGFNGAQINNLFNEASIRAVRKGLDEIVESDFEESIDYILMGDEKNGLINDDEKTIVSYHEAGHALVSYLLENTPNPTKVSIIPRSKGSLGYSQSIPEYEKRLYSKDDFLSQIMVLMGGRIAEEIQFNSITNGASDDIRKINDISHLMVSKYGMSSALGLISLPTDNKESLWSVNSDYLFENVDIEVLKIIDDCYSKTFEMILNNKEILDDLASQLIKNEVLYKKDIQDIFARYNL